MVKVFRVFLFTFLFASAASAQPRAPSQQLDLRIPLQENSVRFVAIGDFGTATPEQYAVARQMELYRQVVKYEFVITLGDKGAQRVRLPAEIRAAIQEHGNGSRRRHRPFSHADRDHG